MDYAIISWCEDGVWSAVPALVPGVFGTGRARREAEADCADALRLMVECMRDLHEPPPPSPRVYVGVARVSA